MGWMAIRGARRRRAVDRSFVLSDHADWDGLLSAIYSTEYENVITTHGYTDIFVHLNGLGLNACLKKQNMNKKLQKQKSKVRKFSSLIKTLDSTNKTNLKVEALSNYFLQSSKGYVMGINNVSRRPKRPMTTKLLRQWASEESNLPQWLLKNRTT